MKSYVFLCYGFPLDIELADWKELICEKMGLKAPVIDFKSNKEVYKDYWAKKDKIIKDLGVSIEIYGSLSEPKYCLSVNDSLIMCPGEFLQKLNPTDLVFVKEWEKKIRKFCKLLDLTNSNKSFSDTKENLQSPPQAGWFIGMYEY